MPELPEMQALAERLEERLCSAALVRYSVLGFHGLKTVRPSPEDLLGVPVVAVGRRAKFVVITFANDVRLLIHLGQAGRLDIEEPEKATKPRGSIVRLCFDNGRAILVREFGHERRAGWWLLGPGDDGPLSGLGPEPGTAEFNEFIRTERSTRRLHSMLRDQHVVAGLGRGHTDDLLHRAKLSPFATFERLTDAQREALLAAIDSVLADALAGERTRSGGLSEAKLGGRFIVHNRAGEPCPVCSTTLARVSFSSYEVTYCPVCQTNGKLLADRRLSKLLR